MGNLYVELKGETQELIQALRTLCELYRVAVLNEALDYIETTEHMVVKVYDVKKESIDLKMFQSLAIETILFKELIADEDFESKVAIKYYRRDNVIDSSMVKHTDSNAEIEHLSSGLIGRCQSHRSRHQNKREALNYLFSKLNAKDT